MFKADLHKAHFLQRCGRFYDNVPYLCSTFQNKVKGNIERDGLVRFSETQCGSCKMQNLHTRRLKSKTNSKNGKSNNHFEPFQKYVSCKETLIEH